MAVREAGWCARGPHSTICARWHPGQATISWPGKLDEFAGDDAIVVGTGLAQFYRLGIGDPLTVISPQGAATAFGTVPRVRAYKVVAVFDAGLNDYNNSVVFMPLPAAQIFFQKPDAITGIEIRVAQPDNVDALLPPLRQVLDGRKVWLRDWRHANDTIIGVLQVKEPCSSSSA